MLAYRLSIASRQRTQDAKRSLAIGSITAGNSWASQKKFAKLEFLFSLFYFPFRWQVFPTSVSLIKRDLARWNLSNLFKYYMAQMQLDLKVCKELCLFKKNIAFTSKWVAFKDTASRKAASISPFSSRVINISRVAPQIPSWKAFSLLRFRADIEQKYMK